VNHGPPTVGWFAGELLRAAQDMGLIASRAGSVRAVRAAPVVPHVADGQAVRWPVGRATVTDGRTPHSPASFSQGAGGDGPWRRLATRSPKADLTDNRVIRTVAPVVAPLAFAVLPCAGSCARSPHPPPGKRRAGGDRKLGA
jgi:hypothetical protein